MATCELFLKEEIDFDEDIAVEEDESCSDDESFDWNNSEFNDFDEDEPDCIPLIVFIDDEGVSKITPAMVSSSSNTSTTTPVQKNKKNVKQKEKEKGFPVKTPLIIKMESEFCKQGKTCLQDSIKAALSEPLMALKQPGISAVSLAGELSLKFSSEQFSDYAKYVTKCFIQFVIDPLDLVKKKQSFFSKFYQLSVNNEFIDKWNEFLQNVVGSTFDKTASLHLHQYIMNRFLSMAVKLCFPPPNSPVISMSDLRLTKDAEATLRYVAGYIVFSLRKRYRQKSTLEARATMELLDSFGVKERDDLNSELSLIQYTMHWIDIVNRGGLFLVNDDFFAFIKMLEHIARTILNKNLLLNYCGSDVRTILLQKFFGNQALNDMWANLTQHMRNSDLLAKILGMIYSKWINLRANSFVKNWIEIQKNKLFKKGKSVAEKAEPAMRKSLKPPKRKLTSKANTIAQNISKKKVQQAKAILRKNK